MLILADDLGWGDIQSNNPDSAMTTPHIDGIAAAGANFTDAHSPSSNCTGTRYGLLTGRYSWRSWMGPGVLNGYDRPLIGPDRPTLGMLLQGHGYRTAAVGKWHLGMDFARLSDADDVTWLNRGIDFAAEIVDSPIDHGFDEFFGTSANLTWPVPVYIRNNRFTAIPDGSRRPATGNIRANAVLDRLTDEAVSFIEREGQTEEPFFLYLPLNAPHVPLAPNAHFDGLTGLGLYADFVAQVDWTVGQVLAALEQVGVHDDTLVIFTSDNGSFKQGIPNHDGGVHRPSGGWSAYKGSLREGGHRIPFLLQWPAVIQAGSTVDATVSLTDLYATLAEIVGEEPAPGEALDSVSLLPILLGNADTRGVPVVHYSTGGKFAIRDGRWKLLLTDSLKLFDLEQDPGEDENVAGAYPAVVERLKDRLAGIRSTEDGMLSGDATLRSLRLAGIDLGPFDADVRTYTATVGRELATVEVIAIPTETDARTGISTPEGRLLYGKPLRGRVEVELADTTTITVRVVAPDKSATATYTVTVTRADEALDGPTITGTVQVGEMLAVDTSGIADADGLTGATFRYQWVSNDGNADTDIQGATDSTYTLVPADEGRAFRVRVSFTDDAGNEESRTSALARSKRPYGLTASVSEGAVALTWTLPAGWTGSTFQILRHRPELGETEPQVHVRYTDTGMTSYADTDVEPDVLYVYRVKGVDPFGHTGEASQPLEIRTAEAPPVGNSPASGAPTISGTVEVDETLTADTLGISDGDGLTNPTFSYQWVASDGTSDTDIQDSTDATYTLLPDNAGKAIKVRVSFIDDAGHQESVISDPTARIPGIWAGTVTVGDGPVGSDAVGYSTFVSGMGFITTPDFESNGVSYTVQAVAYNHEGLHLGLSKAFSTPFALHVDTKRFESSEASTSQGSESYIHTWSQPGLNWSEGDSVLVVFVEGETSEAQDTSTNSAATGVPTISGTLEAGQTLTASTSGISDADGLANATFSYQWIANDGTADTDIEGATGSTYTLPDADVGKTIKVRVSFTDDGGNDETLTSAPAATVAQAKTEEGPTEPPPAPLNLTARANADGSVTVSWDAPDDDSITGYQVLRRHPGEAQYSMVESAVHTGGTETTYTDDGLTEDVLHAYGVRAINAAGSSERSNYDNAVPHRLIPIDFGLGAPTVHLTFDDGPREPYTAQMLDLLEKYGARATFFVIGSSAALHPDIIARMARARHGIGNHTWQHERLTELSRENFDSTVSRTQEQIGAHATRCLRPPYGATDANTGAWAGSLGLHQMKWTLDSRDHTGPGVDRLVSRLSRVSNGSVVLLHEHGGGGDTIEALRIMLDRWARQGYQFKPVCNPPSVPFAPLNNPSEGAPTVSGPVQVGRVLTSDTSGIADGDGLSGASFSHQWFADNEKIASATDSFYLIAAEHEGKTTRVEVSFADDEGNVQQLTSVPTAAVAEAERVSGSPEAPQDLSVSPTDSAGELWVTWNAPGNHGGPETTGYRVEWKLSSGYWGRQSDVREAQTTETSHKITGLAEASLYAVRVRAVSGELEGAASVEVLAAPMGPAPLIAEFLNKPAGHEGGRSPFSVDIAFSEAIDHSYIEFRDGSPEVDGGMVLEASRVDRRSDLWRLAILPHGSGHVTITLPAGRDCSIRGDICTADGKKLSSRLELTVPGPGVPGPGAPATGKPTISGTAQVGQTLTATTSNIADSDGLVNAAYGYQWVRNDGGTDAEIQDATGSTYTLDAADEGKTVKVRVSFTDDAGNEETLVSAPTVSVEAKSNSPATGVPTISGEAQVGETLTAHTSGISDEDGLDSATFTYQWMTDAADIGGATGSAYTLVDADVGRAIRVRVSFTDDGGNQESLTSAPTAMVSTPLTAGFQWMPASHNGRDEFTIFIQFSEEIASSYVTLRDHALTVTGSEVMSADVFGYSDLWALVIDPDGNGDVTIALPITTDCSATGAVCTGGGKKLSNHIEHTVSGSAHANSVATGIPTITGTAQVGETLTAGTLGISDEDGLTNATFRYQWIRNDGGVDTEIQDATASTYDLSDADVGKTIKVRVSFTDDGGNDETLTSAATAAVAAAPPTNTPATGVPTISGTAQVGETLRAYTSEVADSDGLDNATFSYQWIGNDGSADSDIQDATSSTYTPVAADEGKTIKVRVSFTDDGGNEETLTGAATAAVAAAPTPLTASIHDAPENHDGQNPFTFELRFSEEPDPDFSYKTLREHAFTVTGGTVTNVRRLDPPGNVRWVITVEPSSDAYVSIVLPETTDCETDGAVCTEDGRMLSNRTEITVAGPSG